MRTETGEIYWGPALGKVLCLSLGFLCRSTPSVLRGLKAHAVSGARDAIAPHDPHHLLGCPSRPVKAMRIAKPG